MQSHSSVQINLFTQSMALMTDGQESRQKKDAGCSDGGGRESTKLVEKMANAPFKEQVDIGHLVQGCPKSGEHRGLKNPRSFQLGVT